MEWTGECLCGAIKYKAYGDPIDVASCHCVNCRRMSGAAFATHAVFKPEQFEWLQGELSKFAATPDLIRGHQHRH
jgi:hypothetical protein